MTIQARCIGAGFLFALVAITGCEKGDGMDCKLTGKVTYKDAPVGGGTITFHAEDGSVLVACQHGGEVMRVDPSGRRPPVAEWTVPGVSCVAALES